ncbi:MAG: hypothetical protein RSC01_07945, partial [Oscillospiraceae bacterium]
KEPKNMITVSGHYICSQRDYAYHFLTAKAATENMADYATKINFNGIITVAFSPNIDYPIKHIGTKIIIQINRRFS